MCSRCVDAVRVNIKDDMLADELLFRETPEQRIFRETRNAILREMEDAAAIRDLKPMPESDARADFEHATRAAVLSRPLRTANVFLREPARPGLRAWLSVTGKLRSPLYVHAPVTIDGTWRLAHDQEIPCPLCVPFDLSEYVDPSAFYLDGRPTATYYRRL